jgi:phosphatidylglycerophosphate synthase
MHRLAVIDATQHTEAFGPGDAVAGLEAIVRTVRLADVAEARRAVVVASSAYASEIASLLEDESFDLEFEVASVDDGSSASVLDVADRSLDVVEGEAESVMYLRSTTFGFRDIPSDLADIAEHDGRVAWLETDGSETKFGDFWVAPASQWSTVVSAARDGDVQSPPALAAALSDRQDVDARVTSTPRSWQMRVANQSEAERAGDQIWEDCRKPTDGPVSRYANRYVSMAVSRRLARTNIKPNQVSIVALFVAMASAPFAVIGTYWGFLGATLVYKLNSIIDGIDGELSRGKYEFSDLGAWLDKFCDDCADLFWFVGSGIGAWRAGVPDPLGMGAEFWLWIIGIFLTGKALCSVSFYSIPFREGKLVHPYRSLNWWFEDDEGDTKKGIGDRVAGFFKVLTGNDVFVGISLVFAIVGWLPWFLIIMGVGQVFVGIGRTYQIQKQWGRRNEEQPAAAAGE